MEEVLEAVGEPQENLSFRASRNGVVVRLECHEVWQLRDQGRFCSVWRVLSESGE